MRRSGRSRSKTAKFSTPGDRADAFAVQFRSSFRVLWGIAVGILGDAALAEDVVQEAAVIALGKLSEFREGTNFTAWMGQTVRYVALNHARKERKGRTRTVDPTVIDEVAPSTGRQAAGNPKRLGTSADPQVFDKRVRTALNRVAEVPRACLLLRVIEGIGYSEIAELLGIPAGTAMSHVHRTRRFLWECLEDERAETGPPGGAA